ncbi:hypothetical protein EPI10_021827 [Gossypium australe]|uniref:Uncharacterized protein n=1 Tax=Gossypium australe TaxID=47621 RepID=A0A5B6WHV4_9ROSI|nr:hypothetical protein EPI10_021827 [Gossypium australe]
MVPKFRNRVLREDLDWVGVNLRSFLMNHIDIKIDWEEENDKSRMTGFYGHPNSRIRLES